MALSAWQTWPWQSSICVMAINFISIRFKLFSCLVLTIFSASYTNAGGGGGFWFRLSAWKCSSVVALFFFFKYNSNEKTHKKQHQKSVVKFAQVRQLIKVTNGIMNELANWRIVRVEYLLDLREWQCRFLESLFIVGYDLKVTRLT